MSDLFNVDNVPREQETAAPLKLPPVRQRMQQEPEEEREPYENKNLKYGVIFIIVVIVLLLLPDNSVTVPTVSTPKKTVVKKQSADAGELIEGKFDTTEVLEWVNYTKDVYLSTEVATFVVKCESPMLGSFELPIDKVTYTALANSGILPLKLDNNYDSKRDIRYYDNPRLHENWEGLLKGDM